MTDDAPSTDVLDPESLPEWQRARREEIIAAASHLLEQQPFDQIQIKDVAKRADVALGTLYRYFRSKEQLYAAVLGRWSSWEDAAPVPGDTAEERLRRRVRLLISSVERRPHFFTMELALQSTADPQVKAAQTAWSRAGTAWLTTDLQVLGVEPARQTGEMLQAVVDHVLRKATLHGWAFADARATTDAFIALIAGPLAAAEGRRRSTSYPDPLGKTEI